MAHSPQAGLVVAIVNTNDGLVNAPRDVLIGEGFNVLATHIRDIKAGRQDFSAFLEAPDPALVFERRLPVMTVFSRR